MEKINNNLRHSQCPLCHDIPSIQNEGKINYGLNIYYSSNLIDLEHSAELYSCQKCGSSFVQNSINEDDSLRLYSKGEANKRWSSKYGFKDLKTNITVKKMNSLLKPEMKVLDIGCNTGELLDFAKDIGCKTFGVEYSETSTKLLREKGHRGYSNILEIAESFDIITAFDLVEHLYDVPSFLEMCHKILSPNGKLVIFTGNISCLTAKFCRSNWWYVSFPEHIVFPSKKFFLCHKQFDLLEWIPTYADIQYVYPVLTSLKAIIRDSLKFNYSGSPSLTPDHSLIILQPVKFII
jgi:2-polyprenyl-3-methyl-5-hydroxy-6-metoxy-1,4-benzoquinol methylase